MRLQLSLAVAAMVSAYASMTSADVLRVDTRTGIYQDSDETTIGTATTAVRGTVDDLVTVKGRYLADIISSASVDVVSAATAKFDEIRHEAEGGLSYADGTNTVSANYIFSIENDWDSHTIAGGYGRDFFDHQLTLGLGGSFVLNAVGRQDDDNFADQLLIGSATASAAIVATKNDLISFAYSVTFASGYQASPYRFAYLADTTGITIGIPESHPRKRIRHALAMLYNRYLFNNASLRSHARVYRDNWGITSGTAGTELVVGFLPLELGLRVRGYVQSKAAFYDSVYPEAKRYMTADRELGGFFDVFAGAKVGVRHDFNDTVEELEAELRFDGFYFNYSDFPRLNERLGFTAELGLGISF